MCKLVTPTTILWIINHHKERVRRSFYFYMQFSASWKFHLVEYYDLLNCVSWPQEPCITWGPGSPGVGANFCGDISRRIAQYRRYQASGDNSQPYSVGGCSDAPFRCQYSSNLLPTSCGNWQACTCGAATTVRLFAGRSWITAVVWSWCLWRRSTAWRNWSATPRANWSSCSTQLVVARLYSHRLTNSQNHWLSINTTRLYPIQNLCLFAGFRTEIKKFIKCLQPMVDLQYACIKMTVA